VVDVGDKRAGVLVFEPGVDEVADVGGVDDGVVVEVGGAEDTDGRGVAEDFAAVGGGS
jgi:hypothetical protein